MSFEWFLNFVDLIQSALRALAILSATLHYGWARCLHFAQMFFLFSDITKCIFVRYNLKNVIGYVLFH